MCIGNQPHICFFIIPYFLSFVNLYRQIPAEFRKKKPLAGRKQGQAASLLSEVRRLPSSISYQSEREASTDRRKAQGQATSQSLRLPRSPPQLQWNTASF